MALRPWDRLRLLILSFKRRKSASRSVPGAPSHGSLLALPDEILHLICAYLASDFIVDSLLDVGYGATKRSATAFYRTGKTIHSLSRTCTRLRAVVATTLATALDIGLGPDGRPLKSPWVFIGSLHREFRQTRLKNSPSPFSLATRDARNEDRVGYEVTIRLLFTFLGTASFSWAMPRNSRREQMRWRARLLIMSSEMSGIAHGSLHILASLKQQLRCSTIVQGRLKEQISRCERIFVTLWICRTLAEEIYRSVESIKSTDFTTKPLNEQAEITTGCITKLKMLMEEEQVCRVLAEAKSYEMTHFEGEQILISGLMLIVIYLRQSTSVDLQVNGLQLSAVGQLLWRRWLPRMPASQWKYTGLEDPNTHAAFIATLPPFFARSSA